MSILTTFPTREDWMQSCYIKSESDGVRMVADAALKAFDRFLLDKYPQTPEPEILAELREKASTTTPYIFLNDFVQFMANNKTHPRTIKGYTTYLKSYLRSQGIRIYNEDVRQFVHMPRLIKERREPITRVEIKKFIDKIYPKTRAIILVLVSSGLRISSALQLRVSDFDLSTKPVRIRVRAEITKEKEEYETFITQEAFEAVKPFLENKEPDDFVFITGPFTYKDTRVWETLLHKLRERVGLTAKYQNSNRYHFGYHSFRSYFYTICTPIITGDIAHAFMGHHGYLDVYLRLPLEKRIEMYKQVEPYLMIENDMALRKKYENLQHEVEDVGLLKQKMAELEAMVQRQAKIR